MSNPRCNCGAREGTAHATNCTAYLDNIYKRIAELEQENARLREALRDAIDGYEESAQYKGEYLFDKHGDAEEIARLKAALESSDEP